LGGRARGEPLREQHVVELLFRDDGEGGVEVIEAGAVLERDLKECMK
jgi:hypothetical protein